jgi:hypothetical protein
MKLPIVWKPPVAGPEQVCLLQEALRAEEMGGVIGLFGGGGVGDRRPAVGADWVLAGMGNCAGEGVVVSRQGRVAGVVLMRGRCGVGLGEGVHPAGAGSTRNRFTGAIHLNPGSCRHYVRRGCVGWANWVICDMFKNRAEILNPISQS